MRAVITGAASGIGAATVARFNEEGADVAALDIAEAALGTTGAAFSCGCDITSEADVRRAFDAAAQALGGIDAVVNCAGIPGSTAIEDTTLAEWERVMGVNATGAFLVSRAAVPHLRAAGGGSIVLIASMFAVIAMPGTVAYCASKGAVLSMTRALALDLAPQGIRVNAISPGPTQTPIVQDWIDSQDDPAAAQAASESRIPHGRHLQPGEIADAAWFLCSPRSTSFVGSNVVVDGGYSIA